MSEDLQNQIEHLFRADSTNVGDWYCYPSRYFPFERSDFMDIYDFDETRLGIDIIVGGGGLIANTFNPFLDKLASLKKAGGSLIAWGIGESLNVRVDGGVVLPYASTLPDYLKSFDLVGIRDYGTEYRWVPCASCMLPHFDHDYAITQDVVIYEHKRIPLPIDGLPRRSNGGNDIDETIKFLASAETVVTNSYHGAYWATLLQRKVVCIPNMSKLYRFRHLPVICRASEWRNAMRLTVTYPDALEQCRTANRKFYDDVIDLRVAKVKERASS
ncbi:polysaccharide pyruvyl transferase family protein [Neorhizobium alkalisoli]|uniref:Polysaccharide pyruvyl transferase domain-containing protein n=1 Tax=Neorhizobium alkalisoli TaxID=528178 RepID=A0A561R3F1_9HYPH|nr:polysaccharide pyruvyl transferase family protein [Neorhizobium alkalisoli]TWF57156.1 hypothetical protein FHW37_102797 [Neorhizobium alkalisoli]